ncbi:hypothetical protein [Photorhabdus heterorhabditis]|uniref:Uncharacterized protein n=1 Tax=Photorhabdus heterorhabditis TaxID=880156 RepID=A0A5B0WAG6_9GAMM|nr:hypothetical protein [Photorhabdus heterorhabditis]KAA1183111.1 hypothetical protein F0L16_16390 [Photorhabdus heterorhabditis]
MIEHKYSKEEEQKRQQSKPNNATHDESNLPLELEKHSNARTSATAYSKWFTYENDMEVELTTERVREIFSNKQPKIIIAGDGHRSPPFQYAKNIPDVNSSFDSGTLQLYIEATDEQINKNNSEYIPKEFMAKPGLLTNRNRRAGIVGWENSELSNTMEKMRDLLDDSTRRKLTKEEISSFYELHETAIHHFFRPEFSQLRNEFFEIMAKVVSNNVFLKAGSDAESNKITKEMIDFIAVTWRDEYINPTLAEKIAKHAAEKENHTFIVSVGDAHLSINPMQEYLNKMRNNGEFQHQIIFTRAQSPILPDNAKGGNKNG